MSDGAVSHNVTIYCMVMPHRPSHSLSDHWAASQALAYASCAAVHLK